MFSLFVRSCRSFPVLLRFIAIAVFRGVRGGADGTADGGDGGHGEDETGHG